ncbi:MAG: carnitine 3-dehydrogenase [Gammaproteobacteria bacterium]|nr:carnitine 3-dehydrogenase [Gammaproteobacteria bacterium]
MSQRTPPRAAIIGGGVIGGGWAARFLLHGWDVVVSDPDPAVKRKVEEVLANARRSLPALADVAMPAEGKLEYTDDIAQAVTGASWIQESVPERLEIKHAVYATIKANMPAHAIVGSSTSGYRPAQLREGGGLGERLVVAHPFNPVYLLPLVELVGGDQGSVDVVDSASELLTSIGMKPLRVRAEIDAHIADRFLEAVWREGLWMIKDDLATTEEIDDAIRFGFGLRWAQMGLFETYRIAGGEAGMEHFIAQFGPCLSWPWTKLMDVPELTDELTRKIATQSDNQSGHYSIRELERIRDDNLVGMLRALKQQQWGAGKLLAEHDERLSQNTNAADAAAQLDHSQPLRLFDGHVLPAWIDYNGHMTEAQYLSVCSSQSDKLLALIGAGLDYVAAGHSYYTVETHIVHRDEAKLAERLWGTTQIVAMDDKRLQVFHTLYAGPGSGRVVATAEQMFLHVDSAAGKACAAAPAVLEKLRPIAAAHSTLERPEAVGRHVGQRG